MLAMVVVVWCVLMVAICNDAVNVWLHCNCGECCEWRARAFGLSGLRGERLTIDVPMTEVNRAAWQRLKDAVQGSRQQRRKAARCTPYARKFRKARRALRKRWQVKKLLPVHPSWMRAMFRA